MINELAPVIHASHFFPAASPQHAAVIMLKGWELGLSLTSAFEFIDVIQGRPTLSPRGALALAWRSGELEYLKVTEPPEGPEHECTVCIRRKGGIEYSLTWSIEDAKKAGLVTPAGGTKVDGTIRGESNWIKYERNMLRWRAIGYVLDVLFPDAMGGLKRADEFGATVDGEGSVIEANASVI